ncbi:lysophosphatidic acid phosphatase type 6-like [Lethenteron reissneri]|uniref:lysophosphatidic acid phosphatase type 6-like n=1 Tax=Lethenteron reissneri TaxID=7753 RepID=UPI002AB6F743|nr:lysophosphatidic acid phosphatase type 6-like [Lethenteron reissneri]
MALLLKGVCVAAPVAYAARRLWSRPAEAEPAAPPPGPGGESGGERALISLVQVVFRHGARTPLSRVSHLPEVDWPPSMLEAPPNTLFQYEVTDLNGGKQPSSPLEDSYQENPLPGGCARGQLSSVGMQQLYELGVHLRETYINGCALVSHTYTPSQVYVRSTNTARTIESARCLLAGLFQQSQLEPARIHVSHSLAEILYPNMHGCPRLGAIYQQGWKKCPEWKLLEELLPPPSPHAAPESPSNFVAIRDVIVAREAHGMLVPKELLRHRHVIDTGAVTTILNILKTSQRDGLQLCIGRLLDTLLSNIDKYMCGKMKENLVLFSAHDTTLLPLLVGLRVFDGRWPPFASHVAIELHVEPVSRRAFVRLVYNGKEHRMPQCSATLCPLEEFRAAVADLALSAEELKHICDLDYKPTSPPQSPQSTSSAPPTTPSQ